VSTDRNALFLG